MLKGCLESSPRPRRPNRTPANERQEPKVPEQGLVNKRTPDNRHADSLPVINFFTRGLFFLSDMAPSQVFA
jgi:hypothetical protein